MFQTIKSIWRPGAYHRRPGQDTYFEGWYVKVVSPDLAQRWALIPGVFHHPDPDRAHSFLQVLNGSTSQVDYHRFPLERFQASGAGFDLEVAGNHFHPEGCELDLNEDQGHHLEGELRFGDLASWPVRLASPGVMGPYAFIPFMQTYHGVLSLDHAVDGRLAVDGQGVDFSGGRGYMEKDWGTTFPRAYIWMQSNHFQREGVSLTASVATIPWLGSWFRGFLVGLWVNGLLYRFTTYLGSEIRTLKLTDEEVMWELKGSARTDPEKRFFSYALHIRAQRGEGGLLSSPELDGMTPRILESLTAEVGLELQGLDSAGEPVETIFQGRGRCAGLEVAGTVGEILDDAGEDASGTRGHDT